MVVRRAFRHGRSFEYGFDHEPVSDLFGPLLEHHSSRGVFEEAHSWKGGGHDHGRVDPVGPYLHPSALRVEGGPTTGRTVSQVSGKRFLRAGFALWAKS